jgi:hypothetical protein
MTTALEGGEGSVSHPGRSLPPGKSRYPLYRRLGGPQGRSGQVRKISPPPWFDLRTIKPVASRYTDYITWPVYTWVNSENHEQQYVFLMNRVNCTINLECTLSEMGHKYRTTVNSDGTMPFLNAIYLSRVVLNVLLLQLSLMTGERKCHNNYFERLHVSR